jgi:hypothetical protein
LVVAVAGAAAAPAIDSAEYKPTSAGAHAAIGLSFIANLFRFRITVAPPHPTVQFARFQLNSRRDLVA